MGAMHEQPKKAGGRMRKSILQDRKECFCCGTTLNLERHHVIHGTAGRKIADRLGLTIWLRAEHHRGAYSPHQRRDVDLRYKRFAQSCYMDRYGTKSGYALWMAEVGKNYL